jgi:hypothetical protein
VIGDDQPGQRAFDQEAGRLQRIGVQMDYREGFR